MSYYYNYTLGYQTEDGKIFPLGPFDYNGKLLNIISKSRSFASDLHEDFYPINDNQWTDELKKCFSYETYEGEIKYQELKILLLSELPKGSFIKSGYYLIDDIDAYTKSLIDDDYYFDGFYDYLTPETYLRKSENELKYGKPQTQENEYGEKYTPKSCADYSYFCYPDYNCKEYEVSVIRDTADIFYTYKLPKGSKIVVLETEG